jgi:Uma2 family endonuclease
MALALEKSPYLFTVDEYLAFERTAEERHEYLDGVIYAMAGESEAHADISMNLSGLLFQTLRGTACRARSKDTKVRSGPDQPESRQGLYSYPDLVVFCGEPHYHDTVRDVLLNPRVIVEILSPSTQTFDRVLKRERYQTWLPTLQEYVLVAQDRPHIELWSKQPDGRWRAEDVQGLEAMLVLKSLEVRLALRDIYDRILFPASEPEGAL